MPKFRINMYINGYPVTVDFDDERLVQYWDQKIEEDPLIRVAYLFKKNQSLRCYDHLATLKSIEHEEEL